MVFELSEPTFFRSMRYGSLPSLEGFLRTLIFLMIEVVIAGYPISDKPDIVLFERGWERLVSYIGKAS